MKTPEQRAQRLIERLQKSGWDTPDFDAVGFLKEAQSVWIEYGFEENYREACLQALCNALMELGYLTGAEA